MDTSSKLFNDHMKLQRNFEYQMDQFNNYSREKRAKREAWNSWVDAIDKFEVGASEIAEARAKLTEASATFVEASRARRKELVATFDRKSREIGGPGFEAWLLILFEAQGILGAE